MKSVSVLGTQVSYHQTGQGPPLVFLHGAGGDGSSSFGHMVDSFTDLYTVLLPDYAGCGHSTIPDGALSLALLVEQVAAVLKDADAQHATIIGSSLGAQVAVALAAKYPALVRRLVLVGGFVNGAEARHQLVFETWSRLEALDPALSDRFMLSLVFRPAFLSVLGQERVTQLLQRPLTARLKQRIDLCWHLDIRDLLSAVAAPTLVIGMTQDALIPVQHAKEMHALVANSRYAEIDCGHAVFREAPEQLVSLVRTFLA